MTLIQTISKEDIERHWQKNLMAELSMPFSPQSHQYCLWLLNQCSEKNYKRLESLIYKRFYSPTSKSTMKEIKLIPQSA